MLELIRSLCRDSDPRIYSQGPEIRQRQVLLVKSVTVRGYLTILGIFSCGLATLKEALSVDCLVNDDQVEKNVKRALDVLRLCV